MKNLLKTLGLGCLLLTGTGLSEAQEQEALELTLEECVQIALDRNTRVISGKLQRDVSDANVDQARASFLPTLSASYGQSNSINGPRNASFIDESTGALVQSVGESTTSGGHNVGASLGVTLFDASNLASLSSAKKDYHASELDLQASKDQVVFEAKRDYFALLQSMSLLEVQREQVRVSEENLRRAETLNEIGSSPISDVFSAKADLESHKATLILRENAVEINRSNLSFTLGMTADVRIVPTEVEIKIDPVPLTFEKAYEIATSRPGLQADRYNMLSSKDNLRATQYRLRFPTLRLTGSYSWNLSDDDDFGGVEDLFLRNYQYRVGISVNMPIFNMGTSTTARRQKIQYLQGLETYEQAKRQLGLEVRRTLLQLEQLRRSIDANQASVVAQEQDFRLQDEAYNFGAGTFLNRQQAQLRLFTARSNLVRARYDYQIQLATLEQLIGMPIVEAAAK